jgi:formate dehydrogenase iron-sulfur subunit
MMSDACKHCAQAPCIDACPEYAIIHTEFDSVVIQPELCKGYFACAGACPFGVIEGDPDIKIARKCNLCYDRLKSGLIPACAKTCPTDSIQFGPVRELIPRAKARVKQLHEQGETRAAIIIFTSISAPSVSELKFSSISFLTCTFREVEVMASNLHF